MKKYALNNSYFKNKGYGIPDTILEIAKYNQEKGELPFAYSGVNWVYDAFCERQKRKGVYNSQFLTPDETVDRMMHFAGKYFTSNSVLEPCCGTGQITKELINDEYNVTAFDVDTELVELCNILYSEACITQSDFRDFKGAYDQVIANPPYETPILTEFLNWIDSIQSVGGVSILLIPAGFINKDRPRKVFETLQKFSIVEVESMQESFERTNCKAEIVVLRKL